MNKEIIVDGENALLGRVASFAAKKLLLGNRVVILNCDKALMSGNKRNILEDFRTKMRKGGSSQKGPHHSREPRRIVKRAVRGMLPHKQTRGRAAFKMLKCYNKIPEEYKDREMIKGKRKTGAHVSLKELSEGL